MTESVDFFKKHLKSPVRGEDYSSGQVLPRWPEMYIWDVRLQQLRYAHGGLAMEVTKDQDPNFKVGKQTGSQCRLQLE